MFLDWGIPLKNPFKKTNDCSTATGKGVDPSNKSDDSQNGPSFGSRLRYWLQAGAQSTTQAATGQKALAILTGNAPTGLSSGSVEAFALRTGVSWRLGSATGSFANGIPHGTSHTLTFVIADGGFITPTNSSKQSSEYPKVYQCNPSINSACNGGQNGGVGDYLVVNAPARTSFFSNWGWASGLKPFTIRAVTRTNRPSLTSLSARTRRSQGASSAELCFISRASGPCPAPLILSS